MKKWLWVFLYACMAVGTAQADWTVDQTLSTVHTFGKSRVVTIAVVSDGVAQTTALDLFTRVPQRVQKYLKSGRFVYTVYTAPDGTDPPTIAYTMTLQDRAGSTMTLSAQGVASQNTSVKGDDTDSEAYLVMANQLLMTCTDAGDIGDTIHIVLYMP